jgi:hypothetical protein
MFMVMFRVGVNVRVRVRDGDSLRVVVRVRLWGSNQGYDEGLGIGLGMDADVDCHAGQSLQPLCAAAVPPFAARTWMSPTSARWRSASMRARRLGLSPYLSTHSRNPAHSPAQPKSSSFVSSRPSCGFVFCSVPLRSITVSVSVRSGQLLSASFRLVLFPSVPFHPRLTPPPPITCARPLWRSHPC